MPDAKSAFSAPSADCMVHSTEAEVCVWSSGNIALIGAEGIDPGIKGPLLFKVDSTKNLSVYAIDVHIASAIERNGLSG